MRLLQKVQNQVAMLGYYNNGIGPQVVDAVDVPVIYCWRYRIADGRGVAAALH